MRNLSPKAYVAIAIGAMGAIFIITLLSLNLYQGNSNPSFTGGSGEQPSGYLVLSGYEIPVNQGSNAPLGMYLDSSQQTSIRSYLEVILYNEKPLPEYEGEIQPGSADVDFSSNTVSFKIEVKNPKSIYTVQFDGRANELHVFNEDGTEIKPQGSTD